jgi:hypothetical protein
MTQSPLIQNGELVLTDQGLLQAAPDIQTQMNISVSAYDCIYNSKLQSDLIPYLSGIPRGGWNLNAINNIVVAAYALTMIPQKLISNLTVTTIPQTLNFITIKISALDRENNPIQLTWNNAQ